MSAETTTVDLILRAQDEHRMCAAGISTDHSDEHWRCRCGQSQTGDGALAWGRRHVATQIAAALQETP